MEPVSPVVELVGIIFILLFIALGIYQISRRSGLPFTVLLVLIGIGINFFSTSVPVLAKAEEVFSISPDLILFVFLPALIFESSYGLNVNQLRHNAAHIMTLAIPGLLLSTALIGVIVWLILGIDLVAALLLGAILSATDPVAVIALFQRISAPGRLSILIEGESLFNDATALVLSKILIGLLAAGVFSGQTLADGVIDFFVLCFGGLFFGIALGYLTGQLIGWLDSDPIIDIGLTSVLAYLSFLIAEEMLHVSGIMATLGAGLTVGTWGRLRIAHSVRDHLEQFWSILAFVANSLLFLLLGLQVDLAELASVWDLVLWVVLAMLVSRALVVFVLVPLASSVFRTKPIGAGYRFMMFWGGLRGAIALAIVLSLPEYPFKDLFIALVTGAVLFTLLVQGLTIKPVMRLLKLDQPSVVDQLEKLERRMLTHQRALHRMPALQKGGLFSSRVAHRLSLHSRKAIAKSKEAIDQLRAEKLTQEQETNLLFLRAFAEEKAFYSDMYDRGNLSETTARHLLLTLELQSDTLRYENGFHRIHHHRRLEYIEHWIFQLLGNNPLLGGMVERLRVAHIAQYYETIWGHFQGSHHVINSLERIVDLESTPPDIVQQILQQYRDWNRMAVDKLDHLNHDFPEIALLTQERLGQRVVLLAGLETIREHARLGSIPKGQAEDIETDVERRLNALRGQSIQKLNDDPVLLLSRVPLFANLPAELIRQIAEKCESLTLEKHEYLIRQGAHNNRLFLVSRGNVRLEYHDNGEVHRLSTLIAGDSFGESALLKEGNPDLSVIAQTPSRLYTLSRSALEHLMKQNTQLRDLIMQSDARQKQLHQRKV